MDYMDMHVMSQNFSSKVIHQVAGQVLYIVYMDISWMSLANVLDVSRSCMDITLISMCVQMSFKHGLHALDILRISLVNV